MHLGKRKIRSAGRASGSIEITLPVDLHPLEGVKCQIGVRDGARPEIVLQPDLSAAHDVFRTRWAHLRLGLSDVDDIGDFALSQFALSLFPTRYWCERPPLAYVDALHIAANTEAPHAIGDALARTLAFLGIGAAHRLGLDGQLAVAFGEAIAFLMLGLSADLGSDFERSMARRAFFGREQPTPQRKPLHAATWEAARAGLQRVHEQFARWADAPARYEADRTTWYRGMEWELRTHHHPSGSRQAA